MIDLHLSAFAPRWRFLYAVRIDAYMIADMHVHSTFSPDGISTMEEQCIAALEKGERIICFTDHVVLMLPSVDGKSPG